MSAHNPRNDEVILQQHYGDESAMVGHVEAYHLHNSLQQARYLDYWHTYDVIYRNTGDWHEAHKQARLNMPENFK